MESDVSREILQKAASLNGLDYDPQDCFVTDPMPCGLLLRT
jgi:hypothetical protein